MTTPSFAKCPDHMPHDIWEKAYDAADGLEDLYCCDNEARYRIVHVIADALFVERENWKGALDEAAENGTVFNA